MMCRNLYVHFSFLENKKILAHFSFIFSITKKAEHDKISPTKQIIQNNR